MSASLRQFRAFVLLAEERHFTRAAAAMHLSQPAFSALIGALESDLGVRLFDRSKRQVALTPEGMGLEPAARRALMEFDQAIRSVQERTSLQRGRVSIALLPSLAANWLPGVLAHFTGMHPGVRVEVADVLSEACIDSVLASRADFAIAAIRADSPSLQAQLFCADDFYLVCAAGHPLAQAKEIHLRDLAGFPFIHLSRTSSVRQYLEAALHPHPMNTLMEVDQLSTVMGMVRANLGISVVPALTLFHFGYPEIAIRPLPLRRLKRQLYLVRRRDSALSVAGQALCDLAVKMRPRSPQPPPKRSRKS